MSDGLFITRHQGPYEGPNREEGITSPSGIVSPGNPTIFDSEIDLREELNTLIDNRGHYIVLRRITKHRCPNWRESQHEEHTKKCKWCAGTGYMYQDILVKSYNHPTIAAETQARESRQDIGYINYDRLKYYFKAYGSDIETGESILMWPKLADYILEVKLVDVTGLPTLAYTTIKIMDIQNVHAYRDQNGRVEYWVTICVVRSTGT